MLRDADSNMPDPADALAPADQDMEEVKAGYSDEEIIAGVVAIATKKTPVSKGIIIEAIQSGRESITSEQIDQTIGRLITDNKISVQADEKIMADPAFVQEIESDPDRKKIFNAIFGLHLVGKLQDAEPDTV